MTYNGKINNEIRILFVGNSLTYSNNMPQLLQKMLNETEKNIKVYYRTSPAASLRDHMNNQIKTKSALINISLNDLNLRTIIKNDWDYIILQEGAVRILIPEVRKYNVESAILEIKTFAKKNCKLIVFGTWISNSNYPKQYCYPKHMINNEDLTKEKYCSAEFSNSKEYFEAIDLAYRSACKTTKIDYSNNGDYFFSFSNLYPEIDLLEDDIHPNPRGAFLNACIFYEEFTKKSVSKIKFSGAISKDISTKIKKFVSKTSFIK